MKQLFSLILIVFISNIVLAQTNKEQKRRIDASIAHSAEHKYMQQFTDIPSWLEGGFQIWMQQSGGFVNDAVATNKQKTMPNTMVIVYSKRGITNSKPANIIAKWHYDKDKDATVKKVEITGNWSDVANIYTSYWSRPLLTDDKKPGELVYFNSFGDRVAFVNTVTGKAKILITPNGNNAYKNVTLSIDDL